MVLSVHVHGEFTVDRGMEEVSLAGLRCRHGYLRDCSCHLITQLCPTLL